MGVNAYVNFGRKLYAFFTPSLIQQISFFMHLISMIPLYLYISLFNFYDDRWRVGFQSGGNNLHLWCFIYRAPASAPKPAGFFGFSLLIGTLSFRAKLLFLLTRIFAFFLLLIFKTNRGSPSNEQQLGFGYPVCPVSKANIKSRNNKLLNVFAKFLKLDQCWYRLLHIFCEFLFLVEQEFSML